MSKINLKTIDKLIENKCSSIEINLLLHLSSVADEFGNVRSIYYKDICMQLNISIQSFYRAIDNLTEKKVIINDSNTNNTWGNWNIRIVDNIYLDNKDYKKAYLNTNRFGKLLFSQEFKKSSVNVKYLVLKLLKVQREGQNFKISFDKLKKYAGVKSETLLLTYIEVLSQWFDIKKKGQLYYIISKNEFSTAGKMTEQELYLKHKITNWCKAFKICYTVSSLKDVIDLFKQYGQKKYRILVHTLSNVSMQYHSLEPALINKIVSKH